MRLTSASGLAALEVEAVDVGREDGDVAVGEILQGLGRMAQEREAEERRGRAADGAVNDAERLLDLVLGLLERHLGEIFVRPSCVQPMVWPALATSRRISG